MRIIRPVTMIDSVLVDSDVPENDQPAYNAGTTYAADARVIRTSTHRIYRSIQSGNTGHTPESSPTWWEDEGATNRWKLFDGGYSTQTSQAEGLEYVLAPGRVDSLAMLNIEGSTYRVYMTEDGGSPTNIVYDTGVVSLDTVEVGDWYQYFYEPISQVSDKTLTDIPPYVDGVIHVLIDAPAATAAIGALIVGQYRDLGEVQWAPRVSIKDYSIKQTDDFGNPMIVERPYSKRMSCDVFIANALIDSVVRVLSDYRATALVWIGNDEFTSMILFGYYTRFEAVIQSPAGTFYALDIEGLT